MLQWSRLKPKNWEKSVKSWRSVSSALCKNVKGVRKVQVKAAKETRVVIALSGGVDSAVSAYLLKEKGYDVSGIYMRNWSEADEAYCSGKDDLEEVDKVARFLDIPYKVVDFQREYWNHVFEPVIQAYQDGVTPNPDVLCNKEIKFKTLFDFVFSRTPRPDFLATGHYAQLRPQSLLPGAVELCEAADANKDQTYFLLQVSQKALQQVLFPIGHLTKPEVRQLAIQAKLPNAQRKESMGLCFIGKRKFDSFLGEFTQRPGSHPGAILDLESGKPVGIHKGAIFYTVGQSANISGAPNRMFVSDKDHSRNTITVCSGSHHPALYKDSLRASQFNWISGSLPSELSLPNGILRCTARIRHRQDLQPCSVTLSTIPNQNPLPPTKTPQSNTKRPQSNQNHKIDEHNPTNTPSNQIQTLPTEIHVRFDMPRRAIAEGQYIGLYKDSVCLGGGIITSTGPHYHTLRIPIPQIEHSNSIKPLPRGHTSTSPTHASL